MSSPRVELNQIAASLPARRPAESLEAVAAVGCGGGCGWAGGYGPFGLFNGWGPDREVMAAGWNPCLGPFEALAGAFRCNVGGWGWGLGCGWGVPRAGCGSCYWDEWRSDPPRCCDPCPDLCGSSGCGGVRRWCGGGCGGGGYCGTKPGHGNAAYAQNFHPWPRKPTSRGGGAYQVTTSDRAQVRSPMKRGCNCAKCQMQRNVARRQPNSGMRQVNYQR